MKTLTLMINRSEGAISRYISEWVPRWGRQVKILSILDINARYLSANMPSDYL
jgi:hypothetical protein